jgi:hypothetical protein
MCGREIRDDAWVPHPDWRLHHATRNSPSHAPRAEHGLFGWTVGAGAAISGSIGFILYIITQVCRDRHAAPPAWCIDGSSRCMPTGERRTLAQRRGV